MVNIRLLLMLVAILCFALATFGIPSRINLVALGLGLWALSLVVV